MPRSLQGRLTLLVTGWTLLSLVVFGLLSSDFLDRTARRTTMANLSIAVTQLSGALEVATDGTIGLDRQPEESGFQRSRSGWYWLVLSDEKPIGQSRSMVGRTSALLASMAAAASQGEIDFEDEKLLFTSSPLKSHNVRLIVTAPLSAATEEVKNAQLQLLWALTALAAILLAGLFFLVRLALHPMRRLVQDIDAVGEGKIAAIPKPKEIYLDAAATAINRTTQALATMAKRSREDAVNLAHAIKTPLTVIMLRSAADGAKADETIHASADLIKRQIDRRLRRPVASPLLYRVATPLAPVLEDAVLTATHAYPDRKIDVRQELALDATFPLSREELEEVVGNAIDNAYKWAKQTIKISFTPQTAQVVLSIEDDGPGIDESQAANVLRRGIRLDEIRSGNGLGLAIILETMEQAQGRVLLSRSSLGGLSLSLIMDR